LDIEASEQDIVDYLSLLSANTGTKIEVISVVSEHGSMISNLGNIGAILRYNPNYSNYIIIQYNYLFFVLIHSIHHLLEFFVSSTIFLSCYTVELYAHEHVVQSVLQLYHYLAQY